MTDAEKTARGVLRAFTSDEPTSFTSRDSSCEVTHWTDDRLIIIGALDRCIGDTLESRMSIVIEADAPTLADAAALALRGVISRTRATETLRQMASAARMKSRRNPAWSLGATDTLKAIADALGIDCGEVNP